MSVDDVLAGLSPKLRKRLGSASDLKNPEICPTPSIGLNRALNGGFRYGRQILVYGNKSSGKSSFCLQMIGEAQKLGKTAAWIDAETTYDPVWGERLGVNNKNLILSQSRTINDVVDVGVELMGGGIDIIVVDSISTLLPAMFFEKNSTDLKELADTGQMGSQARDMTRAVQMLNYANNQNHETLLVLISQTRNNLGSMYVNIVPTGGKAVQFYSSTIVQLFSSESEAQAITGDIHAGDKIIQQKIGRKVGWDVKFSKTSPGFRSGEYNFYFSGPFIGIDAVAEMVDVAMESGLVIKSGGWYTFGEVQEQGKNNLIRAIRNDENLKLQLIGALNGEI